MMGPTRVLVYGPEMLTEAHMGLPFNDHSTGPCILVQIVARVHSTYSANLAAVI